MFAKSDFTFFFHLLFSFDRQELPEIDAYFALT